MSQQLKLDTYSIYKQAACRKGTKWKKAYLSSVDIRAMWLDHSLAGSKTWGKKKSGMSFWDYVITYKAPNGLANLLKEIIIHPIIIES